MKRILRLPRAVGSSKAHIVVWVVVGHLQSMGVAREREINKKKSKIKKKKIKN
jgi:hypothetical protein